MEALLYLCLMRGRHSSQEKLIPNLQYGTLIARNDFSRTGEAKVLLAPLLINTLHYVLCSGRKNLAIKLKIERIKHRQRFLFDNASALSVGNHAQIGPLQDILTLVEIINSSFAS